MSAKIARPYLDIVVLVSGLALLTIGAGGALLVNLVQFRDSLHSFEHSSEVLGEISRTQMGVLQAEASARGWIRSGEGRQMRAYREAVALADASLTRLSGLLTTDTDLANRFDRARQMVDARLAALALATEGVPGRPSGSIEFLDSETSDRETMQILQTLDEVRGMETDLLSSRRDDANRAALTTTGIAAVMTLLALLGTFFGAYLLQRQRALAQLGAVKTQLEAIVAIVPDAIVTFDGKCRINSFSAKAESMFGMTAAQAIGRSVPSLFTKASGEKLAAMIAQQGADPPAAGPLVTSRSFVQRGDGSLLPVEFRVIATLLERNVQFVAFIKDLTEQQAQEGEAAKLQAELTHVSRLITMGEMASALAHELSQPLTALSAYLEGVTRLLRRIPGEKDPLMTEGLERATAQALRAGNVIRRLREFVGRGETEKRMESLAASVQDALALAIVAETDQPVQFDIALDPSADLILANKVQIQQVLINLIRNAVEAMKGAPRRRLLITSVATGNRMVKVSVADTGLGIPPDVAATLFQSFITTKDHGLGIGLSISRTIVEAHGGHIWAEPNPLGGTIFHFTLRSGLLKEDRDEKDRATRHSTGREAGR